MFAERPSGHLQSMNYPILTQYMNTPNAMFTIGHNNMMQFKCALPVFSGNWESYTKKSGHALLFKTKKYSHTFPCDST